MLGWGVGASSGENVIKCPYRLSLKWRKCDSVLYRLPYKLASVRDSDWLKSNILVGFGTFSPNASGLSARWCGDVWPLPLRHPESASVISWMSIKSQYVILTSPVTYNPITNKEMHTSDKRTFLKEGSCLFCKSGCSSSSTGCPWHFEYYCVILLEQSAHSAAASDLESLNATNCQMIGLACWDYIQAKTILLQNHSKAFNYIPVKERILV